MRLLVVLDVLVYALAATKKRKSILFMFLLLQIEESGGIRCIKKFKPPHFLDKGKNQKNSCGCLSRTFSVG